jgi:uncharacterized membrane-anchored protein
VTADRGTAGWLRRHLRIEDALLVVWLVIVQPLLFPPSVDSQAGQRPDLLVGLLDLAGLLALVACLAARSQPGVVSGLVGNGEPLYAVGPLFGAFALAVEDTAARLGPAANLELLPIAAAIVTAVIVRRFVPPLFAVQRRILVTPFILITSRFFGDFLSGLADMFDLRGVASGVASSGDVAGTAFLLLIGSAAVLIFYVMLVFAPRQVAEREGSPRTWTIPFLLFLVSLAVGQTFAGLLHPG